MGDPEIVLGRFNRLMQDLLSGRTERTCFEPWEVELLVDIDGCAVDQLRRRAVLQRYRKVAEGRLDRGLLPPLKLSEYLREHHAE
jgi:hypothetical protein